MWTESLDWTRIEREENTTGFLSWLTVRQMLELIAPYLMVERAPVSVSQRPVPLKLDCADERYTSLLTGRPAPKPVKLIE